MSTTIAVAGATGNLGRMIVDALVERGAEVRALVRVGTASDRPARLESAGAKVVPVDMADLAGLSRACAGASCVVSALQGLRDVIVDAQTVLLEAAVAAGVPRFIPSDFSIDFTKLAAGENRNFDLRREFRGRLAGAPVASTSILNGAFAELLTSGMPLLDLGSRRVSYWGDADQLLDFTTMADTAAFTADAALDPSAPEILRIAGDQISARGLAAVAGEVVGAEFDLVRSGSLDDLAAFIRVERDSAPADDPSVFPRWQAAQYMHNMFGGRAKIEPLDNDRYPGRRWTTARDVIAAA